MGGSSVHTPIRSDAASQSAYTETAMASVCCSTGCCGRRSQEVTMPAMSRSPASGAHLCTALQCQREMAPSDAAQTRLGGSIRHAAALQAGKDQLALCLDGMLACCAAPDAEERSLCVAPVDAAVRFKAVQLLLQRRRQQPQRPLALQHHCGGAASCQN